MVKNPLLNITPSEEEEFIEHFDVDVAVSKIKESNVVLIVGDIGTGKSHLILELKKRLGGRLLHFNSRIFDEIREAKDEILYIEDFDLIRGFSVSDKEKLIDLIKDKSNLGTKFVIEVTPRVADKIDLPAQKVIIPKMDFETAKAIIENKFKQSGVKNPFSENELKKVWSKSGNNIRMFIMLLSTLYELKVKE